MKAYISKMALCLVLFFPALCFADDLFEIEHLWITQSLHVPGDALCQDGQWIYFKDQSSCEQSLNEKQCEKSHLKLAPLLFFEKIELPGGDSVSQFYSIQSQYDRLRYELVSDGPIKNYELVEAEQVKIPLCDGKKWLPKRKFRRVRPARLTEVAFMQGLVDSGVSIINSPYGKIDPNSILYFNSNTIDPNRPRLKSPLCNANLDYKDLVNQASGEWSGNGVVKAEALSEWHKGSMDLYIHKSQDEKGNEKFEFFCLNEVEDV